MGGHQSKQQGLRRALDGQLDGSGVAVLSKDDWDDVLDVLARAFVDDPMFGWVAGLEDDDPERAEKMYKLAKSMFPYHSRNGLPLGVKGPNDELVGCMTLASSSNHKEGVLDGIVVSIQYGMPPIYKRKEKGKYGPHARKRMEKLVVLTKVRANHMKDVKEWAYLQSIGVRPEHHGKGHGKRMLDLLTKSADAVGMALYLETETERLESMYQRFGFRTLEKRTLCVEGDTSDTANCTVYCMRRDPTQ